MTLSPKFAGALALVLVLAACGGGAEQAKEPAAPAAGGAMPETAATPAVTTTETPSPDAAPSDAPTPEPAPTPSPAATPTASAEVEEPASFAVCKACHSMEPGKHGLGPSLAGIWGEKAGEVPGFEFSQPMIDSGLTWNQANLDKYLADPRGTVPGTKMAFGGVKDAAKRQEIIDYIKAH